MKQYNVQFADTNTTVKSEGAMWNVLRGIRDSLVETLTDATPHAIVTAVEDGATFKDIVFRRNTKGKIEMVNLVKETCRYQAAKAKRLAAKVEPTPAAEAEVKEIVNEVEAEASAE